MLSFPPLGHLGPRGGVLVPPYLSFFLFFFLSYYSTFKSPHGSNIHQLLSVSPLLTHHFTIPPQHSIGQHRLEVPGPIRCYLLTKPTTVALTQSILQIDTITRRAWLRVRASFDDDSLDLPHGRSILRNGIPHRGSDNLVLTTKQERP